MFVNLNNSLEMKLVKENTKGGRKDHCYRSNVKFETLSRAVECLFVNTYKFLLQKNSTKKNTHKIIFSTLTSLFVE